MSRFTKLLEKENKPAQEEEEEGTAGGLIGPRGRDRLEQFVSSSPFFFNTVVTLTVAASALMSPKPRDESRRLSQWKSESYSVLLWERVWSRVRIRRELNCCRATSACDTG